MAGNESRISPELLVLLRSVHSKRPRTVIEHILKHGFVTTEELKDRYGYNHPPRAAADVRDNGIPLETFSTTDKDGRKIAAYRFGSLQDIRRGQIGGRRAFPKAFKSALIQRDGELCLVCSISYQARYLQIDHCVPYLVCGETTGPLDPAEHMLICASCNRAKSWSCEHCRNGTVEKNEAVCQSCYWASPLQYDHIALRTIRRLALVWEEGETTHYERLFRLAQHAQQPLPIFVKKALKKL